MTAIMATAGPATGVLSPACVATRSMDRGAPGSAHVFPLWGPKADLLLLKAELSREQGEKQWGGGEVRGEGRGQ